MTSEGLKAIIERHQGTFVHRVNGVVEEKEFSGIVVLYCDNDKVTVTIGGSNDTTITDDNFQTIGGEDMIVLDAQLLDTRTGRHDIEGKIYIPCEVVQRVVCVDNIDDTPYIDKSNLMYL